MASLEQFIREIISTHIFYENNGAESPYSDKYIKELESDLKLYN